MQKLKIRGGRRLVGEVRASGAKNAALPILAASLLCPEDLVLSNVPDLADVRTMFRLLEGMGVVIRREGDKVVLNASRITSTKAPYDLVKTMRASILTLCPLAARFGSADVSLPGGCAIGARPVDQHIKGLEALGAEVTIENGYVLARAGRLRGAHIITDVVTVTGTENLLMAAVLADGVTVLENAAREPEVVDLAECLNKMGAKIEGAGTPVITVHGVERLHGAEHSVVPDRIEAGSFLIAGIVTRGDVLVTHCVPAHMDVLLAKLREAGADIVTFHYEATYDPRGCIEMIRKAGAKAGVSIKPATSVEVLRDILPLVDLVLVMSVEPGFGGQSFIPASTGKIRALRAMARELGLQTIIEVDGGISSHNSREVYEAGADVLVAGNAVFGAEDPQAEIVRMLNA